MEDTQEVATPRVFTDEWVERCRARLVSYHEDETPVHYAVAVEDKFATLRSQIETWVAALPVRGQDKVVRDLQSPGFQQTYNELAVGAFLRECGYEAEYAKPIEGLTPDWYVHAQGSTPTFIAEVFTDNISVIQQARFDLVRDLRRRMVEIPIGATLFLHVPMEVKLSREGNREIARALRTWVAGRPAPEAEVSVAGVVVRLFRWDDDYTNVYVEGPQDIVRVPLDPLRKKISQKIDRYKSLCKTKHLPLVVAVVSSPWTARDPDDFIDVLHGTSAFGLVRGAGSQVMPLYAPTRIEDGLFKKAPILSAGMWLANNGYQKELLDEQIDMGQIVYLPGRPVLPAIPGMQHKRSAEWDVLVTYNPDPSNALGILDLSGESAAYPG